MKNLIGAFCVLILLASSCSKKKELAEEITKQEILNQKIKDIIPQQYVDTLKKLGLSINTNFDPPNIEGSYVASPSVLINTSVPNDRPIGHQFNDAKFKIFGQTKDFEVHMLGQYLLTQRDTSIVTAIAGSGNDFTVYGKIKSTSGTNLAIFAVIISGTKDGTVIKNFRMGIINIDNSKGGTGAFIPQGTGRVVEDKDGTTTNIDPAVFSNTHTQFGTQMTIGKLQ